MDLLKMTFRALWVYVAKRGILLLGKLLGYKSFCVALATLLFVRGTLSEAGWVQVLLFVIAVMSGIKIAATLDFSRLLQNVSAACSRAVAGFQKPVYGECDDETDMAGDACTAGAKAALRTDDAVRRGKERIDRALERERSTAAAQSGAEG